jgi:REP element-mobilizing transposase RayT
MVAVDYIDFQNRSKPLAFLITFRTYGTWLHGDERGAIDRRRYRRYGTPAMPANKRLVDEEKAALKHPPVVLNPSQRTAIKSAIQEVCTHRGYYLHAVNVRTNHVHAVITASCKPEHVLEALKAYATRKLREAHLIKPDMKPWARHGSTVYLWTEEQVSRAIGYVLEGQGEEPLDKHKL